MTLCHACRFWDGNRIEQPESPWKAPSEEYREGVCKGLLYTAGIDIETNQGAGVRRITTAPTFGCALGQPLVP